MRGMLIRDDLKDRMVGLMKEAWKQGYEDGVHATNVDCGVVWEERIDAIRAEIQALPKTYPFVNHIDTYVKTADVIKIIERHCGGDTE